MKSTENFRGFDFNTTWAISRTKNNGYPYLRSTSHDSHVHSFGNWEDYNSSTHFKECDCGYSEFAPHDWDDGVINGSVKTLTCKDCGKIKEITIDVSTPLPPLQEITELTEPATNAFPDTLVVFPQGTSGSVQWTKADGSSF